MTETGTRGRPCYTDENVMDGRRITVRLPPALCDDLDRLVEDGQFSNESDVVRTALRQLTHSDEPLDGGRS
jgi:metal-responsive CopG/Arc/MetJ family transcriptional regulator